jgi:hypothetical protein
VLGHYRVGPGEGGWAIEIQRELRIFVHEKLLCADGQTRSTHYSFIYTLREKNPLNGDEEPLPNILSPVKHFCLLSIK